MVDQALPSRCSDAAGDLGKVEPTLGQGRSRGMEPRRLRPVSPLVILASLVGLLTLAVLGCVVDAVALQQFTAAAIVPAHSSSTIQIRNSTTEQITVHRDYSYRTDIMPGGIATITIVTLSVAYFDRITDTIRAYNYRPSQMLFYCKTFSYGELKELNWTVDIATSVNTCE